MASKQLLRPRGGPFRRACSTDLQVRPGDAKPGALSDPAIYQRSLGININLEWGIVMLVFGAIMLALGRRGTKL